MSGCTRVDAGKGIEIGIGIGIGKGSEFWPRNLKWDGIRHRALVIGKATKSWASALSLQVTLQLELFVGFVHSSGSG